MTTEGLLRKYKLSKLSDNIVLNKYEQEIVDYLEPMFSDLTSYDVSKNTKFYFNKELFICSITENYFKISGIVFDNMLVILEKNKPKSKYTLVKIEPFDSSLYSQTINLFNDFISYFLQNIFIFKSAIRDMTSIYHIKEEFINDKYRRFIKKI